MLEFKDASEILERLYMLDLLARLSLCYNLFGAMLFLHCSLDMDIFASI